jgi:APA family basic amino acid/polyamine antiporter
MAELRRVLGPFDATCVVVGAIVGVGIFFVPSRVAGLVGDGDLALLTWAIAGAIALLGALTFAELGGAYPRTGGQYEILRDAYGAAIGFVYVFCNATAIQSGAIAVIALVCASFTAVAVTGEFPGPTATSGLAIALVLGLAIANAIGVRWGARIQNATTIAKVATLLFVGAVALFHEGAPVPAATSTASASTWTAVLAGLAPTLFAFGGWQQALWISGEVRRPERTVPIAILVGVAIVVAVYVLANWAYLHLLGHAGVAGSQALAADAVAMAVGESGRRVVACAVAISAFGVLNVQLLTGPRLIYAVAEDGRFPKIFARVHARTATPIPAIAVLAGNAVALLLLAGEQGIDRLLTGIVLVDGMFFALTGLASLIIARRRPRAERPNRMPGWPFVPLLFVLAEVGVCVGAFLDPKVRSAATIAVVWVAVAALLYAVRFRRREPPARP